MSSGTAPRRVFNITSDPCSYILEYLRMAARCGSDVKGRAYRNGAAFLLKHGQFYTPAAPADDEFHGVARGCYGNSLVYGVLHQKSYVEGVAVGFGGLPYEHAWNTDRDQTLRAIDCTWEPVGTAYFGVEFALERADDAIWNGNACVLDDAERRQPLLRHPWRGEVKPWPQSPRIALIEQHRHHFFPVSPTARVAGRLRDMLAVVPEEYVVEADVSCSAEDLDDLLGYFSPGERLRLRVRSVDHDDD